MVELLTLAVTHTVFYHNWTGYLSIMEHLHKIIIKLRVSYTDP